jgi:hypothetical protein
MIDVIIGTGDRKEKLHCTFPFIITKFGIFKLIKDGVEHIELPLIKHNNELYFVVDNYPTEW